MLMRSFIQGYGAFQSKEHRIIYIQQNQASMSRHPAGTERSQLKFVHMNDIKAVAMITASFVAAICIMLLCVGNDSDADGQTSGTCGDDLEWSFEVSSGKLTITGQGEMYDFEYDEERWGNNIIRSVSLPDGLTSIGQRAFMECHLITSITIPDSVKSIGESAFYECYSLKDVDLGKGVEYIGGEAFFYCISLEELEIPDSVQWIHEWAFNNCHSLKKVIIGSRANMNVSPFQSCISLESIEVAESNEDLRSIDGVLFSKDGKKLISYPAGKINESYTVPDGTNTVGEFAFYECQHLMSLTLSDSVEIMYSTALYHCPSLESLTLNKGLYYLYPEDLTSCYSLVSIEVAEGNPAYYSDDGVLFSPDGCLLKYPASKKGTSYTIPDGVSTIVDGAFRGSKYLEEVIFSHTVQYVEDDSFRDCKALKSVDLGDGVTSVGVSAFYQCTSLETVKIPNGLNEIGSGAFEYTALRTVDIPDGVDSIGLFAFSKCPSLESINIGSGNENYMSKDGVLFSKDGKMLITYPAGKKDTSYIVPDHVEDIGLEAFIYNERLETLDISSVTTVQTNAIVGCKSLRLIAIGINVTELPNSPFLYCYSLRAIEAGTDNPSYTTVDGVLFSKDMGVLIAYPAAKDDIEYTIPESVVTVRNDAFVGTKNLSRLTIGDNLIHHDVWAFRYCWSVEEFSVDAECTVLLSIDGALYNKNGEKLIQYPPSKTSDELTVPDSMEELEYVAFYNADGLKSIQVGDGNTKFSSSEGCLLSKDGSILYACPPGLESITLDADIKVISEGTFTGDVLKEVVFPSGMKAVVNMDAFINCDSLERIVIEEGANICFDNQSISYSDYEKHTIYVFAPSGFVIHDYAKDGNIEFIYDHVHPTDGGSDNTSVIVIIVILVVAAACAGAFLYFKKKNIE